MKTNAFKIALFYLLSIVARCGEIRISTTPPSEFKRCIRLMKSIFKAKIIGLELYSLIALPNIKSDDSKASLVLSLQQAGFKILEKDGVINIIDAKERATGAVPYPFSQSVKITASTYGFGNLKTVIKQQTGFEIHCFAFMLSFRMKWDKEVEFLPDEVVSVREILNRVAANGDGMWVVERESFMDNMSPVAGEYIRTNHPKIRESDAGELLLPDAQ